ncbi:MAG: tetratricopeptide repeat protein [Elusimicrobia bacterium]|nr:tetratricopeptide repeat protein [Elusimicrobiota bacterium]
MNKQNFKKILSKLICAFLLLNLYGLAFADTGRSGGTIFLFNPNPVTAAMGGAGTALLSDKMPATTLNPASSIGVYRTMATVTNANLIGGIQHNYIGIVFPSEVGNFGVGIFNTSFGNIPGYMVSGPGNLNPTPFRMRNSGDLAFILNYSVDIRSHIPLEVSRGGFGMNIKLLRSRLENYVAEAIAVDLGFIMALPAMDNITVGVAYRNLGSRMRFAQQDDRLPEIFTLGIAYRQSRWHDLVLAADLGTEIRGRNYFAIGGAITPVYYLTFRAGLNFQQGSTIANPFRGGIGFAFQNFFIDYAYTPASHLNASHSFSFSYAFGQYVSQRMAFDHHLQGHFRAAQRAFRANDYIAARRMFDEILSVFPDHRPSQRYLHRTIDQLDRVDVFNASRVSRYMTRAQRALSRNNTVSAGRYFRRVLEIDPENLIARAGLDDVREITASVRAEHLRMQHAERIEFIWNQADHYFRNGELVRARRYLGEILEIDPQNQAALDRRHDIDNQISQIAASQVTELLNTGMRYFNAGVFDESIRYFEAVVIAAPHRLDVQDLIVRAQRNIQDTVEAERRRELLARQDRVRGELMSNFERGLTAYERNRLPQALNFFRRAQEIADEYEFTEIYSRSQMHIQRINHSLSDHHYRRGFDAFRRNAFDVAAREYRLALEFNPGNTAAIFELERVSAVLAQRYFEMGMDAFARGNMDRARENLRRALHYRPDMAEARRALERVR